MAAYTIRISELQRHLIERALKEGKPHMDIVGDGEVYKTAAEEFDALVDMFTELPSIPDAETTLHGFCL